MGKTVYVCFIPYLSFVHFLHLPSRKVFSSPTDESQLLINDSAQVSCETTKVKKQFYNGGAGVVLDDLVRPVSAIRCNVVLVV